MNKDKKKRKIQTKDKLLLALALVIILTLVVIPLSITAYSHIRANTKVRMKDPGMEEVIKKLYVSTDKETGEKRTLTYADTDRIKSFRTGSWNYYETIVDIAKFKNLESLSLNTEPQEKMQINSYDVTTVVSEDKLKVFCNDLSTILKKDTKLTELVINGNGEKIDNLKFLKNGANLEGLYLKNLNIDDYSNIGECKNLKKLSLGRTSVETADQLECLKKLDNLKRVSIVYTPLAKNEDELKKLQEMLPNVEITFEPVA